jgi:hypothetical protein
MRRLYSWWISRWEDQLANRDTNRVVRPFEWGFDWLGLASPNGSAAADLEAYSARAVAESEAFFGYARPNDFRLEGASVQFTSPVESPYECNNTVRGEYFPAPNSRGRATLVIPQWNSGPDGHIGLCKLLNRFGISALRLSPAYHHRRMPAELERADYHVSSNVGRTLHATRQSVIDARAALDWLELRGYHRLGLLGTSLGSCISLLALAHDRRPRAAVFNHVSMHFSDVVWNGISCRHIRQSLDGHISFEQLRRAWAPISPASYLERLRARETRSLLIWAGYDTTFLPEYSLQVLDHFRRLGIRHDTAYLPCGHYTSGSLPFNLMDGLLMCRYLRKHL